MLGGIHRNLAPLILAEEDLRLAFVSMNNVKFLESSKIATLTSLHLVISALAICHSITTRRYFNLRA